MSDRTPKGAGQPAPRGRFLMELTLYTPLGKVVVREVGNDQAALVAYARSMVAERSAKFWRVDPYTGA